MGLGSLEASTARLLLVRLVNIYYIASYAGAMS